MSPTSASDSAGPRVCIYRGAGPTDAHLVRDMLVGDGIPVEIRGELLSSLQGAIPVQDAWPSLWVRPHNAGRAQALITAFDEAAAGEGWRCSCGEDNDGHFGSCWKCSADRPGPLAPA